MSKISLLERLAFNIIITKTGRTLIPKRNLWFAIWCCIEKLKRIRGEYDNNQ